MTIALLIGCTEYGYTSQTQVDAFQQRTRNAVDLLVVVDNSCSMAEEQDNLARNFDALIDTFAGADVSWRVAVTTTDTLEADGTRGRLMGGDDEVILVGPLGELDRVAYDREWGFEPGTSLQLDGGSLTVANNDTAANWCASTASFGEGGHGTPGAVNAGCAGEEAPFSAEPAGSTVVPSAGQLVISEILATSSGDDRACEWFEITNVSDETLDLTGVSVRDEGNNAAALPAAVIAPHAALVVGRAATDNCGAPVDAVLEGAFSLMDDLRVVDADTPAAEEAFAELVAQGTSGTGVEMGLEAAKLVFDEPYYTDLNDAWLREDANLAILFVSDEDDKSPGHVDEYLRFFGDLKGDRGHREPDVVTLSAVVGKDPPPAPGYPSCESQNGSSSYGARYLKAAATTGGLVESICAADFAPIVEELGLTLSGLEANFYLSGIPDLATMSVRLYADEDTDSLLGELVQDEDYSYVIDGNYLHFDEDQLPPSGTWIIAEYVQLPDSAEIEGEGSG